MKDPFSSLESLYNMLFTSMEDIAPISNTMALQVSLNISFGEDTNIQT